MIGDGLTLVFTFRFESVQWHQVTITDRRHSMKCDRCSGNIGEGEEKELHGRTLCEDCYMDSLSPAKACDPWAVYTAKSFSGEDGAGVEVTEIQAKILRILEETGGTAPETVCERLGVKPSEFEREIATLRHMEKVRGEMREGKRVLRLW